MLFALIYRDKPDQVGARARHSRDHLAYLRIFNDQIIMAGPLLSDDRSHSLGSLLVMEFPDRRAAEAFSQDDPFNAAGIFESIVIRPYKNMFPEI